MKKLGFVFILLGVATHPVLAVHHEAKETDIGFWAAKDCRNTSKAAGLYSYVAGVAMQKADAANKAGQTKQAQESNESALLFSQLSANLATTFEAFCKDNPKRHAKASD